MSNDPDTNLVIHVDSGNFTLNLTNMIDTDDLPASQTSSGNSSGSSVPSSGSESDVPFAPFEKMIIVHGVFTVSGFLVILPFGAIFARWGRSFTDNWFYYHWTTQVILSIPVIVVGWALGPLAVATQDVAHANDAHKVRYKNARSSPIANAQTDPGTDNARSLFGPAMPRLVHAF